MPAAGSDGSQARRATGYATAVSPAGGRRRFLTTTAVVFALLVLAFAFTDNMASNEIDTLMAARQWADPAFLPGDWFLNLPAGPRTPFQILLWPLVRALPLIAVSIVGRTLALLGLAFALSRLAWRLGLTPAATVLAGGMYVALGQSLVAGEWIFGALESKVAAYALIACGLDRLIVGKLLRAGLLFGAATTLHVIVGGWATLAAVITVLWTQAGTPRERWRALAAAIFAAAPGLALGLWAAMAADATSGSSASALYVYFRNPHHADPRAWNIGWTTTTMGLSVLVVLVWTQHRRPWWSAEAWIARFALATLLPLGVVVIAMRFPTGHAVLQLFPFRVGSAISLFAGVALATTMLLRWFPESCARWLPRVAASWIAVMAVQAFAHDLALLRLFPEGGRPGGEPVERALSLVDACVFVRQHTQPDAIVLASPAIESVGYLTRRPVVVLFKCVPPYARALHEWHGRLVDMNGGNFRHRGWAVNQEVDRHFGRLSTSQYLTLGEKYRASVLLIRRRDDLDLPLLYANAHWSVLALPTVVPRSGATIVRSDDDHRTAGDPPAQEREP